MAAKSAFRLLQRTHTLRGRRGKTNEIQQWGPIRALFSRGEQTCARPPPVLLRWIVSESKYWASSAAAFVARLARGATPSAES
jgi:hypothetical protein